MYRLQNTRERKNAHFVILWIRQIRQISKRYFLFLYFRNKGINYLFWYTQFELICVHEELKKETWLRDVFGRDTVSTEVSRQSIIWVLFNNFLFFPYDNQNIVSLSLFFFNKDWSHSRFLIYTVYTKISWNWFIMPYFAFIYYAIIYYTLLCLYLLRLYLLYFIMPLFIIPYYAFIYYVYLLYLLTFMYAILYANTMPLII